VKLLPEVTLGPGQIHPRGYRLTTGRYGEIKLGLLMTKGQLEVEVVCARNIACEARESLPGKKACLVNSKWLSHNTVARYLFHMAIAI
jgi:hypothetical protein